MTRFVRILSAVLVLSLLFCGCAVERKEKTVAVHELVLTLPANYVDLSDQDYAAGFSFVYGFEDEAVLGIYESRDSLETYYPDITAEKYAQLFIEVNGYDSQISRQNNLCTFTHSATVDSTDLTYLCGIFMSGTSFWCVQFYCPTESFPENESRFMGYLQAIAVQEALTN